MPSKSCNKEMYPVTKPYRLSAIQRVQIYCVVVKCALKTGIIKRALKTGIINALHMNV